MRLCTIFLLVSFIERGLLKPVFSQENESSDSKVSEYNDVEDAADDAIDHDDERIERYKESDDQSPEYVNNENDQRFARRSPQRYVGNGGDQPEEELNIPRTEFNKQAYRGRSDNNNKRTAQDYYLEDNEDEDPTFEDNNSNKQSSSNREDRDANLDFAKYKDAFARKNFLKYFTTTDLTTTNQDIGEHKLCHLDRDRRQTKTDVDSGVPEKLDTDKATNEDDETAIRRHIRRLSKVELDELLSSLSDEKKGLLKKIIDYDGSQESVAKRDITKKAGAVEENGLIESAQSESNTVQNVNLDSVSSTSTSQSTKGKEEPAESQTDTVKSSSNEALVDKFATKEVSLAQKSGNIEAEGNTAQFSCKSDSKREVDVNDFEDDASLDYSETDSNMSEDYPCLSDSSFNYIQNEGSIDESDLETNERKRDVTSENQSNLSKSLAESFPKADNDIMGIDSEMAPLIRVKRKNNKSSNNKDNRGSSTDAKIQDEEDVQDDFNDEELYDRTSHLNSEQCCKQRAVGKRRISELVSEPHHDDKDKENAGIPMTALGSDTDSVLSGVEGVNDNLMQSGVSRNKRSPIGKQ